MRIDDLSQIQNPAYRKQIAGKLAAETQQPIRIVGENLPMKVIAETSRQGPTPSIPVLELTAPPDTKIAKQHQNKERYEQIEYFDRVRRCFGKDGAALPNRKQASLIFCLANENSSGVKMLGVLRWKMGVRAGLPDIGIFAPRIYRDTFYHGLFIEMKREDGTNSDVSDVQRDVHLELREEDYCVIVAFGWERAWAITCEYLGWEDEG